MSWFNQYNENEDLTVSEYAAKWLEHYAKTGQYNYDGK
jgi:hypothetical protein